MKTRAVVVGVAAGCMVLSAAVSRGSNCARTSVGFTPINDLGTGLYLGQFQGGLYPGGSNLMPQGHFDEGVARAAQIRSRNTTGQLDPSGKVVMMSIGMSNTTQEWCSQSASEPCDPWSFTGQALASPDVDHARLAIVDGASGGQTSSTWDNPTDPNYDRVRDHVLAPHGLTEAQVQVIWLKSANADPTVSLPNANADARVLEGQLGDIVRAARVRYPNLAMVFLSSRIYAGYATSTLNPEPYAYETGFGVKWVIEAQIRQHDGHGVDPAAGDLSYNVAPWLAWGPYLWADGTTPRGDGLTWVCSDFRTSDGTHPETPGRTKVANMLMQFFLSSPQATPWFRADHARPCNPDYNGDGDIGTDADIEAFFACLGGACCPRCTPDFNADGDLGTDGDIEAFFRVLGGGACAGG